LLIPNIGAAKQGSWIMTLTLNAGILKKMIDTLDPEVIIPVYYGIFAHYREPAEKIRAIRDNRIRMVEVGTRTILTFN
jgi:hypothetical protein